MSKGRKTKHYTLMANLIAIAVILQVISQLFLPQMKFGGGVTLASCVPIMLIGYRYGMKWGLFGGGVFALVRIVLDYSILSVLCTEKYLGDSAALKTIALLVLNYAVAYMAMGLGGLFRNKPWPRKKRFALGALTAMGVRFAAHLLAVYFAYGDLASRFFANSGISAISPKIAEGVSQSMLPVVFTLVYNSIYMIPETAIAVAVAWMLSANHRIVTRRK